MDTKERIVETASEMFERYGIRSVTMSSIAAALAISKKTIYQFFKDKDEIVSTCTRFLLKSREGEVEEIMRLEGDAIQQFLRISDHMKRNIRSMNPTLLYDLQRYHPQAWKLYEEHRDACMLRNMMVVMEKGIKQGVFRSDIHVGALARMRVEQIQMGFDPRIFPAKTFDMAEVQIQFFNHFLRGLCTSKGLQQIELHEENQQKTVHHNGLGISS